MLGITQGKVPRFVKNFMHSNSSIAGAIQAYVNEVRAGTFPSQEYSYGDGVDASRVAFA
jgi:3-methyl-2-oxobutanoate hydroxymethyltransferase